jgi:exosortase F-associated protein
MLTNILNNKKRAVRLFILVLLLVGVRLFEKQLFYDPFLDFFAADFQHVRLPEYNPLCLFFGLFFRYFLNTVISLAIIYAVFSDLRLLQFTALLYSVFFVLLIAAFFGVLHFSAHPDYLLLFYIRRFLIQPLFVLLFVPAFAYQRKKFPSSY